MNDTVNESSKANDSAFLPVVLLALAIGFFFIYQLNQSYEACSQLKARKANADQQIATQVMQSAQIQAKLEGIVRDLIALDKSGDKDAKTIVKKYGITETPPAGTAPVAPPK